MRLLAGTPTKKRAKMVCMNTSASKQKQMAKSAAESVMPIASFAGSIGPVKNSILRKQLKELILIPIRT